MAYYAFVNDMAGTVGTSGPDTVNMPAPRRVLVKRTDNVIGWYRGSPLPIPSLPNRVLMYNTSDSSMGWRDPSLMGWSA